MAVDFESGSSQVLNMPAATTQAQTRGAFSMSAWFQPESIQNANLVGFSTNNGGAPTSDTRAAIKIEASLPDGLQVQMRAPDSGGRVDKDSTASIITAGVRYHTSGTVNVAGDSCAIYLNGALNSSSSPAYTNAATDGTTSASAAVAGEENGGTPFFDGLISDILIHSRQLNAAEVATIYACRGAVIPYFGLLSRWQLKALGHGTAVVAGASVRDGGALQTSLTPAGGPVYAEARLRFRRQIS